MYRPFRASLQALREEFARAANRHPNLFYEGFAAPMVIPAPGESLEAMWRAFVTANETQNNDKCEEWHISHNGAGCGRFYGDLTGVEDYKRLAESLYLVLYELDQHIVDADGGFLECSDLMIGAACDYPTALLRLKNRTWRIPDESAFSEKNLNDLHEEMSAASDDGVLYPTHPYVVSLVHNVFTSAIAFIDAILNPDEVLMVGNGLTDNFPFALPKNDPEKETGSPSGKDDDEVLGSAGITSSVKSTTPVARCEHGPDEAVSRSAEGEARYIFKRESRKQWHIQFGMEPGKSIPHTVNLLVYARLLANPGRPMSALELVDKGADVEREAKCIHAARSGVAADEDEKFQIGVPDDAVDNDTIKDIQNRIRDLPREIEVASNKHDTKEEKRLEEEYAWCCKYLNESVRDRPDKTSGRLRSRHLGSPSMTEKLRKRVSNNISRGAEDIRPYNSSLADYLLDRIGPTGSYKATWTYDPKEELGWEVSWEL